MSSSLLGLISRSIATNNYHRLVSRRNMCELLRPAAAPCLMLPPSFPGGGKMIYNFYSPTKDKLECFSNRGGREEADLMGKSDLVGSSRGWLALINFRTNLMSLCNPLSGRRVDLPPLAGEPFPPGYGESDQPPKVIISSSPAGKDCRALMSLGDGTAAVCSPGRSKEWVPLGDWSTATSGGGRAYLDFVYSAARERFFGLAVSSQSGTGLVEELEGWEIDAASLSSQRMDRLNRFTVRSFESHRPPNPGLVHHVGGVYLVFEEESDRLFLVRRYNLPPPDFKFLDFPFVDREKADFDVFRIDDDGGLELCSSLDGLVMFVGINESFAVRASRFPELKPNTIYYSDARQPYIDEPNCQTIEAFDYQDKTSSPVYYPSRNLILLMLMHLPWFFPALQD